MDREAEDMVAIPIKEFVSGANVSVDVFIKLSDQKYVMIAKQNSSTQAEHLKALESKAVTHLYVRRDDYKAYVGSSVVVAGVLISKKELSSAKKADFLAKSHASVMQEILMTGFNPETFEHARAIAQSTTTLVETKNDLYNLLNSLSQISDTTLAHSLAVSAISLVIGKKIGWTKPGTFEKVALGGLLHDIGLKELPRHLIETPRSVLTPEEIAQYESHPFRGVETLRTVPSVPDDVVSIVFEHHENALGLGYPRKIKDIRMNPLAKIVALADTFCELTMRGPTNMAPRSAEEALSFIEITMGQPFNREAFTALGLVIKSQTTKNAA